MVRTILNMHVHLLRNIPETNESYCFFLFFFLFVDQQLTIEGPSFCSFSFPAQNKWSTVRRCFQNKKVALNNYF